MAILCLMLTHPVQLKALLRLHCFDDISVLLFKILFAISYFGQADLTCWYTWLQDDTAQASQEAARIPGQVSRGKSPLNT